MQRNGRTVWLGAGAAALGLLALTGLGARLRASDGERDGNANFAALRAETLAHGREIADLAAQGDGHAIFTRFAPATAAQIPEAKLQAVLQGLLNQGPLGKPSGDNAMPVNREALLYTANLPQGDHTIRLTAQFNAKGELALILLAPARVLPPDPKADYKTKNTYRLPFDGTWLVFWGGDNELLNYHVVAPGQRHAYDIVQWRDGGTHTGDGARNDQYYAWGQSVLAPAAATIVETDNDQPDNDVSHFAPNPHHPAGNHVVLDCGAGEYLLLAHMQRGSVKVRVGDKVKAGQTLGKCGNSGNTTEPHVHVHLQNQAALFHGAVGLPLAFSHFVADERKTERAELTRGQFVANSP